MSRATSLFQLGEELVRRYERAASDRITIIPVIVDELDQVLPILDGLCLVSGGRLFNVRDPELQGPVPRSADVVRRTAITRALTAEPATPRHVDLIDAGPGQLDAVFADPPAGIPTPGEETVLGVARALAHSELDEHSLAVIAYQEDLVDLHFRRAIWALAVDQLTGMPQPARRTIVFVAQAPIDISMHCQTGRGFQLALDGDRLLYRKGADDLSAEAARIARLGDPFVLYLGAGFSASSQLPLGNNVRDVAIRRLLDLQPTEMLTSPELATRFHAWVTDKGWLTRGEQSMPSQDFIRELTLEQVIRIEEIMDDTLPTLREFRARHDDAVQAPGPAVLDLCAILERAAGRIIVVEVNFDELVERHIEVPFRVFASSADFAEAPNFLREYLDGKETRIPILKLHGTISDPASCVVSAEQTESGIGPEKLAALRTLVGDVDKRRAWIYIGTTLRDLDIRPVLLGEDFGRGLDERWVSPYLTETVEEFGHQREPQWRATQLRTANDRLITEAADAFFGALLKAWL